MIGLTRHRAYLAAGALIVLANAFALVGVAYNRSGEPEGVLTLSERELLPRFGHHLEGESDGLTMSLAWRVLPREERDGSAPPARLEITGAGSPAWFDREQLEALGFDLSRPLRGEADRRHYRKQRPREVLLALELDGAAHRRAVERAEERLTDARVLLERNGGEEFRDRVKEAEQALDRERDRNSRLFVVDVGLDRAALRTAYPDRGRYAIVHGQVRLRLIGRDGHEQLVGMVGNLTVDEINVPHALQGRFTPLRRPGRSGYLEAGTRFRATVAFGQRLEPWIVSAEVADAAP